MAKYKSSKLTATAYIPSDEQLIERGLVRLEPDSFVKSEFNNAEITIQWVYKEAILSLEENRHYNGYVIFDKDFPEYRLMIKTKRDFEELLEWVDQGKTIVYLMQLEQERLRKEVARMEEFRKTPPYLEDYRFNNIGSSHFEFKSKPGQKIFMPYEYHGTLAFRYTMNDFLKLENATDTVHTGAESHTAISLWFLTLESYINTLVKLCCVKKNEDFDRYRNQTLPSRLSSLVRLLEIDPKAFNRNKIFGQLDELCQFRNELFHDRHFGEEIEFKHTAFSSIPIFNSQIDEIQTIKILVEIASMLRYAIEGLDTMPTVILHTHAVAWVHLRVVYQEIFQPYLTAVLDKHQMRTTMKLDLNVSTNFRSTVFEKGEILCLVQADQDPKFDFWLNPNKTSIGNTLYQGYMDSLNISPDTLRLPKVTLG